MVCTPYRDKDQDTWGGNTDPRYNCALKKKGGGWFGHGCGAEVHLTGLLTSSSQRLPDDKQLHWHRGGRRGNKYNSWREAEMKLVEEPWDGTPGKERCPNLKDMILYSLLRLFFQKQFCSIPYSKSLSPESPPIFSLIRTLRPLDY